MALSEDGLKVKIVANLVDHGFASNEHGRMDELADAIAKAVVEHIQEAAEVIVKGGGSYGGEKAKVV